MATHVDIEYILPLKAAAPMDVEFLSYVTALSQVVDVTVVDASPPHVFAAHAQQWSDRVQHLPPVSSALQESPGVCNGKVLGVLTGLSAARHDKVVIADDDVRYSPEALAALSRLLDAHGVVRPQNCFQPRTWHSQWDTARSLINRAVVSDYPGTLGVHRQFLPQGYRADVLFENLEMIRTVIANGGTEHRADDLFVRRLPPTTEHFFGQRIRQAYDSQAQPLRLALELLLLPALLAQARRPLGYLGWAIGAWTLAEFGRRRRGGSRVFTATASLWAPVWVSERALTSWLALICRVRGGIPYAGARLRDAATPLKRLRSDRTY